MALPQHEIAQPFHPACSDQQVREAKAFGQHVLGESALGDCFGIGINGRSVGRFRVRRKVGIERLRRLHGGLRHVRIEMGRKGGGG